MHGYDPVEIWNSTSPIFGANGINEVANAIYSIGFGTKWGHSLYDEKGNWTETLENTAAWLSGILAQDLATGALYSKTSGYANPSSFASDIIITSADVKADGATGAVNVNHTNALALKEGTVSFTFELANLSKTDGMTLFSKDARDFGSGGHTQIYVNNDELWIRAQSKSSSNWYKADLDAPLKAGVAYDVAFTFGPNGLKLYLDGQKVISEPTNALNWTQNREDLVFGGNGDWRNSKYPDHIHSIVDGKISNAAVYDRALNQGEVSGLHGVNTDVTGSGVKPVDPVVTPIDPGDPIDPTTPQTDGVTLNGDSGNNILTGTSGDDIIYGGDGNDKINGGAGDDLIDAGAGKDGFVKGGTGADIFRFGPGDGDIKIFDWEDGIDQIELTDGLKFSDLAQSTSSFNGISTVIYTTYSGARLMFRDQKASDIDQNDFSTGEKTDPTSSTPKPEDYDTQFVGGSAVDKMVGTSGRDWIDAGGGNDKLNGKGGDDYIIKSNWPVGSISPIWHNQPKAIMG